MGKEWNWAGRSSKRGGGAEAQTPSGCMCAVFHIFDFHPFHFPTTINHHQQQTSCIQEDHTTIPKGAEAPRNSLESEDGRVSSDSKEENFKIPKKIQIKTSGSTRTSAGNLNDLSSEISNSPVIKTPTLVARLMGLDLLPGEHSPSSSSSSCLSTPNLPPHLQHLRHKQHIQTKPRNSTDSDIHVATTHSLPETPRISSARRSDVDHHRLSLQINKENMMNLSEELELPRFSFSKRKCSDENNVSKSPSHYARQIVKQVKESVSRKVGQDITNTLKSREQAREEFAGQLRIKKSSKTSLKALDESSPGKHSNSSSYSPRLMRFMDNKNKPSTTTPQNTHQIVLKLPPPPPPVNTQPQLPRVLTKAKTQALPQQQQQQQESRNQKSVPKCKKVNNEKFNSRLKRPPQTSDIIRNKQEEAFIIRPTSPTRVNDIKATKSKKTQPLSSNFLNNINTVPNLIHVKTDPSPPATKIHQKQSQVSDTQESKRSSQLSSCSSQRYKQEGTSTLATRETSTNNEYKPNGASTTGAELHKPEFQYITEILSRTTSLTKQGTPTTTTTLDPSIFHHLELDHDDKDRTFTPQNELGHRWNRRLLFDLVDEVLKEILRPKGREKGFWFLNGFCYQGSVEGLTERVWKRVGEFPCAKCEVLDDIDGLIEGEDMEKVKVEEVEEEERLVAEIERNIWDTLVHETVMVLDCCESGAHLSV